MNYEFKSILQQIAGRFLTAIPFFLMGGLLLEKHLLNLAVEKFGTMSLFVMPILAIVSFGIAGFIIAPPIGALVAYPLTSLFYPPDSNEKPPPLYSVPEWLIKEGRTEEAIEEYEKIIRYHPQEIQAHLALIKIYQTQLPDRERESRAFKRALKELRSKRDRSIIRNTQN